MTCTVELHNRLSTLSSSAGTNLRACTGAGCTHLIFSPRGAGGASDNQGKHRHPISMDKAQAKIKSELDAASRERGQRRVLIVSRGKRRWGWL